MTADDEAMIKESIVALADRLPLRYGDEQGLATVKKPIAHGRPGYAKHRWRVILPAVVTLVVAGTAATATVINAGGGGISTLFSFLHPDKSQQTSRSEEQHVTIGTVKIGDGMFARGYVTTKPGNDRCVGVETLNALGAEFGGQVGTCMQEPANSAALSSINKAVVGWLPSSSVITVNVSASGYEVQVPVVLQQFIISPPPDAHPGMVFTITGTDVSGDLDGMWSVALDSN